MSKQHYADAPSEKERKTYVPFLSEDEELVLATGYGGTYLKSLFVIALLWPGLFGYIIGVGSGMYLGFGWEKGFLIGFVLSIFIAIFMYMHTLHAHRYLLTTRRVIIKKGVLAVKLTSALFDKITHLEMEQSFLDKLLYHHGTIIVHTAGSQKDEMVLRYVEYPMEFKNVLERLINRQREHYGVRGGPITTIEGEVVD